MKRISSGMTFIYKKLFPVLWFGMLAVFAFSSLAFAEAPPAFLIMPVAMAAFGYFIMKSLVWDLADEVFDCGDSLLIRNRGQQYEIPLSEIMNVSSSTMMNPQRITLRFAHTTALGEEVVFSPVYEFRLNPFAKSAVAEDLIVRAHEARSPQPQAATGAHVQLIP